MVQVSFDAQRLFALMEELDIGLILASSRHNVRYLTGGYYYPLYMWDGNTMRTQHLSFVAVPLDRLDGSFFIGRPTEEGIMDEGGVWPYERFESERIGSLSTIDKTVEVLRRFGLDRGRIGVELSYLPADAFQKLAHELPDAEFIDASAVFDPLRAIKRPEEIRLMRIGLARNLESIESVLASGCEGETTLEVADRVRAEFRQRELHYLYSLVCAGPSFFRAPSEKRIWQRGRPLHIDAGGVLDGYIAEVCRSGFLGPPTALADELLQGCHELSDAARKQLRPAVAARELQGTAEEFLRRHELGRYGRFIAHGIGMVHHEDPVVNSTSQDVLQAGMVLSVETEFLHPEVGHVKVEDTVLITDSGNEVMTPDGFRWHLSE